MLNKWEYTCCIRKLLCMHRAWRLTSSKSQEVLPVVQVLALRSHLRLLGLQVLLQGCQLTLQRRPVLHGTRLGQLLQGRRLDRLPPPSCAAAAPASKACSTSQESAAMLLTAIDTFTASLLYAVHHGLRIVCWLSIGLSIL